MKKFILPLIYSIPFFASAADGDSFVIGTLGCELGNNLFQVATTCAHAWDHDALPYFPDLAKIKGNNMPENYAHVFFRCSAQTPNAPVAFSWKLPPSSNFCYMPIPYQPNMQIMKGTFQSEKFFLHHREQLLELFAPHPDDLEYIKSKYADILSHPMSVGVQIRWFGRKRDKPWSKNLAQYGLDYFSQAISHFPEDALFIVSSNNMEFARANLPKGMRNVIFLEGEAHYIDLYVLSMCKHQIISNSSYGWWAAWLNNNPEKIVITPQEWINPKWHGITPVKDVWPEGWIQINAKWKKL